MLTVVAKAEPRTPTITLANLKVDYMKILSTQSLTGKTEEMMKVILDELAKIKNLIVEKDDYGNIYVTKGKITGKDAFPAFVCHTDTVHKLRENYQVHTADDNFWYATSTDDGEFQQVGVGGDDKCGIILCLELLHRLKVVKCAFFLDEEQGCKGSNAGLVEFFNDCRYAIQIDRRDNGDIITSGNGVTLCSKEFTDLLIEIGKTYQYSPTMGMSTDVVTLKRRGMTVSACNLSAGYYNPHTKQEYINIRDLLNCLEFCVAISRIKTVYPHKYAPTTRVTPSNDSYGWSYGNYRGNSWGASEKKSVATRTTCIDCGKDLTSTADGALCTNCIETLVFLHVFGDNSQELVITDNQEGADNTITEEPSTQCRFCGSDIIDADETNRGFCKSCSVCRFCKMTLRSDAELHDTVCDLCSEDGDTKVILCKIPSCRKVVYGAASIKDGMCRECYISLNDIQPLCQHCGVELDTDEEVISGVCATCIQFIYGM